MSERVVTGLVERDGWEPGPWDDEPDRIEWRDEPTGFPCLIIRHPYSGNLCGYVAVPPGHPFHGLQREATPLAGLDVHDRVTYAAPCADAAELRPLGYPWSPELLVCHKPEPGEPDDVWWFGFAASRYNDVQPGTDARFRKLAPHLAEDERAAEAALPPSSFARRFYRDVAFMRAECSRLAAQLAEVTPDHAKDDE